MNRFTAQDTGDIELWWTDLDTEPSEAGADPVLSADERARAARFVQAIHRHRHAAARVALRRLLSRHTGLPAEQLAFVDGPWGKPSLREPAGWAFNVSHSERLAVFAVAPAGAIGVDVELLRAMPDAEALAGHHFTAAEQDELARTPEAERPLAFLYGWTRKEACLKAVGCGLQVDPHTVDVGLVAAARAVPVDAAPDGPVSVLVESFRDGDRAVVSWARVLPSPT